MVLQLAIELKQGHSEFPVVAVLGAARSGGHRRHGNPPKLGRAREDRAGDTVMRVRHEY